MKKRTISKLKSIFGSKKGKRQHQQEHSTKNSPSPSPEPPRRVVTSPVPKDELFKPIQGSPPPNRIPPPPSPPVPTNPVAPVAPQPAAPLPLLPCGVCGRTFVPVSLAKHVKICEKTAVKKRKTFDSSRQRREGLPAANGANSGTDLEQYLPKNFGLPENSPFLEKSPPATSRPTPKPKAQVRNPITKPMAELQRCPHCNRAFGVRAFERHVEWCADKAKILPAAPAQPPQHIADAKQRLNARTQYRAPPVRGRRSSQTRDKSSNSRSASVESSRGVASPQPREYGDYKHGRTRASESVSSNDCHDESSPHMPVIRNSRNSQNSSSGDANVKARQARLARDLSSSRQKQEPNLSSANQSNTDLNIKKNQQNNIAPNPKESQKTHIEPNVKKSQKKYIEPNTKNNQANNIELTKKSQQSKTESNVEKKSKVEPNTKTVELIVIDPPAKKNQRSYTNSGIKKNQQAHIDSNTKKTQQGDPDTNTKSNHQRNSDKNIKRKQQSNPDTEIKKNQLSDLDTNINKKQQSNPNSNIKNNQRGNTDTINKKNQQAKNQHSTDSDVQEAHQSSTEPNIKRTVSQTKLSKITARKQQQLKKLEEIVHQYNEKSQKTTDEMKKSSNNPVDKSHIPIPNQSNNKKKKKELNSCDIDQLISDDIRDMDPSKINNGNVKKHSAKTPSKASETNKKNKDSKKLKMVKEISMSLDSLETSPASAESNEMFNTLLCVPCIIHGNPEKKGNKKNKGSKNDKKSSNEQEDDISEPKVELLFINPTILDTEEQMYDRDPCVSQDSINSNYNSPTVTPSTSDNFIPDEIEAIRDSNNQKITANNINSLTEDLDNKMSNKNIYESNRDSISEKIDEDIHSLTGEPFEENYERESVELSCESIEDKYDDDITESNEIECRHGSGETYTKFIHNAADLEEFMDITDKLISNDLTEKECSSIANDINSLHTPTSNSIEAINKQMTDVAIDEPPKHQFSDTFQELKSHLRELLEGAGNTVSEVLKKTDEDATSNKISDASRKVRDMEHITVYQLQFYEKTAKADEPNDAANDPASIKLPSIMESNKPGDKVECSQKKMKSIYKPKRKIKMLGEQTRFNKEYQTFIVNQNSNVHSDDQSESSEPALKLPRIENRRLDDTYDPFVSAARQMKELMSSDTNIPKKIQTTKDHSRTLPALQPAKDKGPSSYLRSDNSKMIKDTLNKTYQKTPTLQRMKSFGSSNNENSSNTFGGRCSSFRLNRNDKKPSPKLNTTFTKSSKENISTVEKNYFNRNSNLNRSFSSYTASSYSTPKPKDKIPKIATSLYHSFQRTTIKQPVKLDKIKRDDEKKDFVNLDAILADDNSSMTDSNYIDPRLINENDNLPINVNTILNNPDIISSMESLLTTENLPKKFESFNTVNQNNNKNLNNNITVLNNRTLKDEPNNNISKTTALTNEDLSMQYDKLMYSLEQSIASKTSIRDDDSLCEDFDLEDFMTSFDEEINKHKIENKRTCSSTTRVVKQSELADSNRTSELNSISSSPKVMNSMNPVNKSMSLNFSSNNVSESLFPSSVKRSTSLLDSIQRKHTPKLDSGKSRHKSDQVEQDLMQSLKDFDKFYENEKNEHRSSKEVSNVNGTTKRDIRMKTERKIKKIENLTNGNHTPNGKQSNDSAYSSLNRISPSKLSVCTSKEPTNGLTSLEQIPAGSDSSGKEDARSISSDEFLAMERSAELDEPLPPPDILYKEHDNHVSEKRASSRASSSWRAHGSLSSSGSEASLARRRESVPARRPSRFCHECGSKFPVDSAKFCMECGVKRLVV